MSTFSKASISYIARSFLLVFLYDYNNQFKKKTYFDDQTRASHISYVIYTLSNY